MTLFLLQDLFINFFISLQDGFCIIHIFLTSLRILLFFDISIENWFAYWNWMGFLSNNLFSACLLFGFFKLTAYREGF